MTIYELNRESLKSLNSCLNHSSHMDETKAFLNSVYQKLSLDECIEQYLNTSKKFWKQNREL